MAQIIDMYLDLINPALKPMVGTFPDVKVTGALPQQCYSFARTFTMAAREDSQAAYVEGFVFIDNVAPVGHAWFKDERGRYVDGTTVDASFRRMGVEIPAKVFNKHMRVPAFALEYERHNDMFPFVRAFKRVVPDGDLLRELLAQAGGRRRKIR
jgi:hypothetical protein